MTHIKKSKKINLKPLKSTIYEKLLTIYLDNNFKANRTLSKTREPFYIINIRMYHYLVTKNLESKI